jgi:hypothetical protein
MPNHKVRHIAGTDSSRAATTCRIDLRQRFATARLLRPGCSTKTKQNFPRDRRVVSSKRRILELRMVLNGLVFRH